MGYEYYIYPNRKMDTEFKKNFILAIKKHSLFFREYEVAGKIYYEFRHPHKDLQSIAEFIITVENDSRIYLLDNGHADKEVWKILEAYFVQNGGYRIDDDV